MADPFLLLDAISLGKSVAQYLGLVESIDVKVDLLVQSELKTGMQELEQAVDSTTEEKSLLRSARSRFNKATTLETGHKRCLALIGLAICHRYLDDHRNARRAIEKALGIESTIRTRDWIVATVSDSASPKALLDKRWLKKRFREAIDFRKAADFRGNMAHTIGYLKKKEAIGPTTEQLLEDQKRLLVLQKVAKKQLKALPASR